MTKQVVLLSVALAAAPALAMAQEKAAAQLEEAAKTEQPSVAKGMERIKDNVARAAGEMKAKQEQAPANPQVKETLSMQASCHPKVLFFDKHCLTPQKQTIALGEASTLQYKDSVTYDSSGDYDCFANPCTRTIETGVGVLVSSMGSGAYKVELLQKTCDITPQTQIVQAGESMDFNIRCELTLRGGKHIVSERTGTLTFGRPAAQPKSAGGAGGIGDN